MRPPKTSSKQAEVETDEEKLTNSQKIEKLKKDFQIADVVAQEYLEHTKWDLEKAEKLSKFIQIIYGDNKPTEDIKEHVQIFKDIGWDLPKAIEIHLR